MNKPSPKDIVLSLMSFVGKGKRTVVDQATGNSVEKCCLQHRCPKPRCSNPIVSFIEKTGYRTPYEHLKRCYAKGQDQAAQAAIVLGLYNDALLDMQRHGGTIRSHFEVRSLSAYDKAVHAYTA